MIDTPNPWTYLVVLVFSLGLSYVLTGSAIGRAPRTIAVFIFRRTFLTDLFFCPACSCFWIGGGVSFLFGLDWSQAIVMAFSSCFVAAAAQSLLGLAADDKCKIAKRLELSLEGCSDGEEERDSRGGRNAGD